MSEELNAESRAFVRSFDEPRDIGDHKAAVLARFDDSEVRFQRGERVIGDLRTRGRDAGDQCRFSGVWESDEPHIGEQLELEAQMSFFALASVFVLGRGLVRGSGKTCVAAPAAPAL